MIVVLLLAMNDFNVFSPVQKLDFSVVNSKNILIDVKRDDMIHPYVSGNKWRKLKYIIQHAKIQNKSHLVTFGGAWSNHILATACISAMQGFKSTAYIRGESVENPVLQLCKVFGMELHFVDRITYKNKELLFQENHKYDESALFINEGGFSELATYGCAEILIDLPNQYDHIVCACGTGATLAGIAKGATTHQKNAVIHGIPVLKGGDFIKDAVHSFYPELNNFRLHLDYHFGGYAKTKPELITFINKFCAETGILIEPVYTGKLFYAVYDLIEKEYFNEGDRILIVHTGGLTGFLGKSHLFN